MIEQSKLVASQANKISLPCPGRTVSKKQGFMAACWASKHFLWSCKNISSAISKSSFCKFFFLDEASWWTDDLFVMSFRALRVPNPTPPFLVDVLKFLVFPSSAAPVKEIVNLRNGNCKGDNALYSLTYTVWKRVQELIKLYFMTWLAVSIS